MNDANSTIAGSAVTSRVQDATLNKRFDFNSYAETRQFLDELADLSKREEYYPNINFGKTYVNVSIDSEGMTALNERNSTFIVDMQALITTTVA